MGPFLCFCFVFSLFFCYFISNFQFKTTSERPKWAKQVKSFKASQGGSSYGLHLLFSKSQNLNPPLLTLHPNLTCCNECSPGLSAFLIALLSLTSSKSSLLLVVNKTLSVFADITLFGPNRI